MATFLFLGVAVPAAAQVERTVVALRGEIHVQPADGSLLSRPAGLSVKGVTVPEALGLLSTSANVSVAFSPSFLPGGLKVDCDCREATMAEALDQILSSTEFGYLELGDQIVIAKRASKGTIESLRRQPSQLAAPSQISPGLGGSMLRNGSPMLRDQEAGVLVPPAAEGTITGQVVQAVTLRPLVGVQVVVEGTGRGSLTNASGSYLLTGVPAGPVVVQALMIGYQTAQQAVEVRAEETVIVDFVLTQQAIALDGIVVTGTAGVTQRRAIGNAVTKVPAADVVDMVPASNVTRLLQGRTPGLTIVQPAGTMGTAANFRIRGASSIGAGNRPVFYVDGVRIEAGSQGAFNVGGQTTSALDAINPEDIESIEVIKGPAAATLYGAEAAAGVIQIITKQGRAGEQGTQWTAKVDLGRSDWHLPIPDNYTLCTPARIAGAGQPAASAFPGCAGLDPLAPPEERILKHNPLRDDGVLRNGLIEHFNLSARGGGDRHGFYLSADRNREEGVFSNNYFNRTSARGNFSFWAAEGLDFNVSVQFSRTNTRLPQGDNASHGWLRNALRGLPGQRGNFAMGWRGLGPEQMASYDNRETADRFFGGFTVNYQPLSWFRNRLVVGLDAGTRLGTLFYAIDRTGKAPFGASRAGGEITENTLQTRRYTVDYGGTISNEFTSELSSALSFGANLIMYDREMLEAVGEGLTSDFVRTLSSVNVTRASGTFQAQNSLGFYLQEQVGWNNRLFLTAAIRVDDNSAFGEDFSTIIYPKLSAAWVISEEPFFKVPWVDNLRVRAAWGQAGNAPAPFSADRTYAASTVVTQEKTLESALSARDYGNPDLHAERGSEFEFGFETSLLSSRAGVDVTFYNSNTYDALVSVAVAPSSGFSSSSFQNLGHIRNRGIEMALFGVPVQTRDLHWEIRSSIATNSNRLISWGGGREDFIGLGFRSSQRHDVGYPLAGYWAEELLRNPDGSLALGADGRPTFGDFKYVGPSLPTKEVSLTNTLTLFSRVTLYAMADYQGGHYLLDMNATRRASDQNDWKVVNPNADPEEVLLARWGGTAVDIHPADFIKLRELSATYSLPAHLIRRTGAEYVGLTLAGRNLNTWTRFSQPDPEVNIDGDGDFTRGASNAVPGLRQFVVTVNVRF